MPSLYSHHYCYIYSFLHSLLSPDTLGCFYCHRAGSRYSGVVVSKPLEGGLGVLPQWGYRGQLPCWKAQGAKPPGKITILSNSNLKFRLSWLKKQQHFTFMFNHFIETIPTINDQYWERNSIPGNFHSLHKTGLLLVNILLVEEMQGKESHFRLVSSCKSVNGGIEINRVFLMVQLHQS